MNIKEMFNFGSLENVGINRIFLHCYKQRGENLAEFPSPAF